MAKNRLNRFLGHAKAIQISSQAPARCVPSVPLGAARVPVKRMSGRSLLPMALLRLPAIVLRPAADGATVEGWQNGPVEHIPQVHGRAVQVGEHHARRWITAARELRLP